MMREVEYFNQSHPLIRFEDQTYLCWEEREMAKQIKNLSHPHPLVWVEDQTYVCRTEREISREISHFSHSHPLVRTEHLTYLCEMCFEPGQGSCYSCYGCSFYIHEKCANQSREITHSLHLQHPLILSDLLLLQNESPLHCNLCKNKMHLYGYHCSDCNYSLHLNCLFRFQEVVSMESHEHPFSSLVKHISFTCDACGEAGQVGGDAGDAHSFLCSKCHLIVHQNCVSLPPSIVTTRHKHPIYHSFRLLGRKSDGCCYCKICLQFLSTKDHGFYSCRDCDYFAHTKCATRKDIWDNRSQAKDRNLMKIYSSEEIDKQLEASLDSIISVFKHIQVGEDMIPMEIKHFSHQHNLIYIEEITEDKTCDICGMPILSSFYSCNCTEDCRGFFLHKSCSELPRIKPHPFHPHPLHLLPVSAITSSPGVIWCDACSFTVNRFVYHCPDIDCDFDLDIQCALLPETLIHITHEHSLVAYLDLEQELCNACKVPTTDFFKCRECNYILDFKCSKLPAAAMHKYDTHPLTLIYRDDVDGQYCCEICEGDRDPNHWFYHCYTCNFDAHPGCVVGKEPYIRLGSIISHKEIHIHPLTFVQKTINCPSCNQCKNSCTELSLECQEPECSFIIHWECATNGP